MKKATASLMLLCLGLTTACAGQIDTSALDDAEQSTSALATDREVFQGIMFGKGAYAQRFPRLSQRKNLDALASDPKERAQIASVIHVLTERVEAYHPDELASFAHTIRTGDHDDVRRAVERVSAIVKSEAETMLRGMARAPDKAPAFKKADCVDAECLPEDPAPEVPGFPEPTECATAECLPPEPGNDSPSPVPCDAAKCLDEADLAAGNCGCMEEVDPGQMCLAIVIHNVAAITSVAAVVIAVWKYLAVSEPGNESPLGDDEMVGEILANR